MPSGLKSWIADAARARQIDLQAEAEFGLPSRLLMERAGLAVFDAVREVLPSGGRLAVMAGKGNNGGDGFVVARLAREAGYAVECLCAATEGELSIESMEQASIARAQGLTILFRDDARYERRLDNLASRDLIVDALLGTGTSGETRGAIREAIQAINRSGVPVLSIDVPSGVHTDTGEELGESVWALRTVVLGMPKPFLFQGIGIEHSGYWDVREIGLPPVLTEEPTRAKMTDPDWVGALLPERLRASHKGDSGSVVIVAGSRRMRGAAVIAARAAVRAGAGLVTVAGVGEVCDAVAASVPEALLLPLPDRHGAIAPEAADDLLDELRSARAVIVGPGLSMMAEEFLARFLPRLEVPSVVDADALTAIGRGVQGPAGDAVYTPHPGEMGRLLRASTAEVQADRFASVARAVDKYGHTILLKGAYSLVGDPGLPILVNPTGNPGMATGGMGDALGGVIATLLAQELPPYYAAACGAYWHGAAGDRCCECIGSVGFTPMDLADRLPLVRQQMVRPPESAACSG